MLLLLENEVATDRWEPIGVGDAETPAAAADAVAELAAELLPGRFRYRAADRAISEWHYLEFDTTGATVETLT
ncbi:MAG: hypothetical protein WB507_01945 [Solirubrobacterales bacterium]